jgi:hypothetical protein
VRYPVSTVVRAVVAVLLGAGGAAATAGQGDLSGLDLGQWLTVIGTGLVSGGALLTHPRGRGANELAVASVQDVVAKTAEAHETLTRQAVESIDRVRAAVGDLTTLLPPPAAVVPDVVWQRPLGALTQQILNLPS